MTARDRRTLALGAAVIVSLFAIAKGLPVAAAWERERMTEWAHASRLLAESSIDPRNLNAARDSLMARGARLQAIDSLLPGAASASAAVAQLASALEDLADSCGVRVTAVQLRPDSMTAGGLTEVAARVNGTADVAGLAAFLRAIASARTPFVVRELTVTAPEPTAPAAKAEALRFDALVAGLSRTTREASRP